MTDCLDVVFDRDFDCSGRQRCHFVVAIAFDCRAEFHWSFAIDNGIAVRGALVLTHCQPVLLSFVALLVIAVV